MRWAGVVVMVAACGVDGAGQGIEGQLSAEGLYSDIARKDVVPDARELTPAYPLWSDGAVKRRWMILPEGTELDTTNMDHWQMPVGGKLFKEFVVGGRRVETRMIERRGSEEFRFAPFVWFPDESDAVLAEAGAIDVDDTGYDVPSSDDCVMCHRGEPGRMLGVSAVQLSAQPFGYVAHEVPDHALALRRIACRRLVLRRGHRAGRRGRFTRGFSSGPSLRRDRGRGSHVRQHLHRAIRRSRERRRIARHARRRRKGPGRGTIREQHARTHDYGEHGGDAELYGTVGAAPRGDSDAVGIRPRRMIGAHAHELWADATRRARAGNMCRMRCLDEGHTLSTPHCRSPTISRRCTFR